MLHAWEVSARWVLQNGKFVLTIPFPRGFELVKIQNINTLPTVQDLRIEGTLYQEFRKPKINNTLS